MIIGLTGGIGTGKTTVAKMFAELGAEIIDADDIGKQVVAPGTKINEALVEEFGADIRDAYGTIDRKKLASIVFNDQKKLEALNKITHPQMIKLIKDKLKKLKGKVVVIDAAVLFESGMQKMADKIVVVDCDEENQVARLVHKGMGAEEAKLRIKSQMPKSEKAAKADFVIDNNCSLEKTHEHVKKIWGKLK